MYRINLNLYKGGRYKMMKTVTFCELKKQVHQDLINLLWTKKQIQTEKTIKLNGTQFILSEYETSSFSEKFEIEPVEKIEDAIPLYGYPVFEELSPDQKYVYMQFLQNPYDGTFPSPYVFLLYCGLERHILNGNAKEAYDVVFKLREVYKKPSSFRHFSARCIMYIAAISNDKKLFNRAVNSFNFPEDLRAVQDYYIFAKYKLNIPLNAKDIMMMASKFGFKNKNYINKYPQLFEETLTNLLINKTNADTLSLQNYVHSSAKKSEPTYIGSPFANKSILYIEEKLDRSKCNQFVSSLLQETHDKVKAGLVTLRKSGTAPEPQQTPKRAKAAEIKVSEKALAKMENELLSAYSRVKEESSAREQYDAAEKLCNHYYSYRNKIDSYGKSCLNYGEICLGLVPKIKEENEKNKKKELEKYTKELKHYSSVGDDFMQNIVQKNIDFLLADNIQDKPIIDTIANSMIQILEEENKLSDAAAVCDWAIEYYSTYFLNTRFEFMTDKKTEVFKKKKEKMVV